MDSAAPRHFLTLTDLDKSTLEQLLDRAAVLKADRLADRSLEGKSFVMIFYKASTRTRLSFEVGAKQLGAQVSVLNASTTQLGRGEPIEDSARVMSRYADAVMIRTYAHEELERWASVASCPVINGLSDRFHPCQLLADLLTCREAFPDLPWSALPVAWIGDGNNMAHSWIQAARILGFPLRLACPAGYEPEADLIEAARRDGAEILLTEDPVEATRGALVVTTDVWASMGQEEESRARQAAFAGYQVDEALFSHAETEAIFLHCLPAHRGEEVSEAILEGERSWVWTEAENRLHAQKALLLHCLAAK